MSTGEQRSDILASNFNDMNREIEPSQIRRKFLADILNRIRKQKISKLLKEDPLEFLSWMAHEHKRAMIGTTAVITSLPLAIGAAVVFRHWLKERSLGRIDRAIADNVTASLLEDPTNSAIVLPEVGEVARMMGGPEQLAEEARNVQNEFKLRSRSVVDPLVTDTLSAVEEVSESSL